MSDCKQPALPVVVDAEIDPAAYTGYFVYLLWGARDDDKPMYVGSSRSILPRLGSHLNERRGQVGWIGLIRCANEAAMLEREGELIRLYRPAWNRSIPLVPELYGGRKVERAKRAHKVEPAQPSAAAPEKTQVPLATDADLSAYFRIPEKELATWRSKHYGPPYIQQGRFIRYRWSDVKAWVAEQERGGQPAA